MKTIKSKNKLAVVFFHLDHDQMIYYLDIGLLGGNLHSTALNFRAINN